MNKYKTTESDDWAFFLKGEFGSLTYYKNRYYMCEAPNCDNYATMTWRRDQVIWYCGKHFMENRKLWSIIHQQHP